MFRKLSKKYKEKGPIGVYDSVRFRIDRKIFKPYKKHINIKENIFVLNIEDFEAHTWFGKYRYNWIVWPEQEFDWIADNLSVKDVVLDIGAHQGIWSMLFAKCAREGEVHAFETSRFNSNVARKNLRDNHITNVVFNNMCIGNEIGFATVSDDSGGVASLLSSSAAPAQRITVPMITGDEYARTHNIVPSFVKIDVEGFEVEALSGLQQVLSRRPKLLLELHNFKFSDKESYVKACLSLVDLTCYRVMAQTDPGTEMRTLAGLDDREIALIASGQNPHLYCCPI